MTCKKKGDCKEENKEKHVEKLTGEELDKVSGGKVCLICQPQHENQSTGKVGCGPTSTPHCEPQKPAPEFHWCSPTGGCKPKQE